MTAITAWENRWSFYMNETKDRTDLDTILALKAQLEAVTAERDRLLQDVGALLKLQDDNAATLDRHKVSGNNYMQAVQLVLQILRKSAQAEAQLAAAHEALRVFAERGNWIENWAIHKQSCWYGPEQPWALARKALEGK